MTSRGRLSTYEPRWIRIDVALPILGISFLCPAPRCDGRHRIRVGFADMDYWMAAGRPQLYGATGVIPNDFGSLSIAGEIDDTSDGFCDFKGIIRGGEVFLV